MSVVAHWDGRKLYAEWCGSPFSDRAAYWRDMNPADKAHWEELAKVVNHQHEGAVEAVAAARAYGECLMQGRDGRAVEWRIGHDLLAILDHPGGQ